MDFHGDIKASDVENLRKKINLIILSANPKKDEVLLRLESPGGMVHSYGLAAAELARLRDKNFKLIICVDKVAASGGYLMASTATKIIAAPFAIVGSIGVIAELPNFNRLLKKLDVDIEQHTAGEFKRTLTMLGPNTDKGREKFREELNEAHDLFKHWVSTHRQQVDIDKVATGEHWFGTQAIDLKLVDELGTSDDYLMSHSEKQAVFQITFEKPKQLTSRLTRILQGSIEGLIGSGIKQLKRSRFNWHQ
ncbi:MAG: protease SohB [Gammaproteobacteria bacterium CG22_combo_CG10-13_8_21_14_all_40_8]|nr:MAG: protease SohB [Gammaproteobacteria bacterium CG22_combo_CG10-13_8_21_14_all_40_8]